MRLYCEELLNNIEVLEREILKNSQKINGYDKVNIIFIIIYKFIIMIIIKLLEENSYNNKLIKTYEDQNLKYSELEKKLKIEIEKNNKNEKDLKAFKDMEKFYQDKLRIFDKNKNKISFEDKNKEKDSKNDYSSVS
jgi:hypothetical protein